MERKRENLPPQDGREWIAACEAAEMMQLSASYFVRWARKRELETFQAQCNATRWFLRSEVASMAEFRRLRRSWYKRHRRSGLYPRTTQPVDLAVAKRIFIGAQEAAEMLGMSARTVADMVYRGRLVCYQSIPGRKGSRLWFSRRSVEQLQEDEKRRKHRKGWEERREGADTKNGREGTAARGVQQNAVPADWLTPSQAAERLGGHVSRVHELRQKGRIRGERLWGKKGWLRFWYFPVWEVERLLADENYMASRERWRAKQAEPMEARGDKTVAGAALPEEVFSALASPLQAE